MRATVLSSNLEETTKMSSDRWLRALDRTQIYTPQKIINYASVKKRGRLQSVNEKEEFSKQCTVNKDRPAGSRPAGERAGRDYYFSNREEGHHLMAFAETVT